MKKILLSVLGFIAGASVMMPAARAADVTDSLSIKGDIRNRFESIDQDEKDSRARFRVRARVELSADVNEEVTAKVRMASGSDDPVSTNQSFDDGFSSKGLQLDRAYVDWNVLGLEGVNFLAGKMGQPWKHVKDLVHDGDLSPEGFALNLSRKGDALDLALHGGAFVAEERSSDDDTYLFTAQAVATVRPSEDVYIEGGSGLFAYTSMEGYPVLFDEEDSFGNTASAVLDADGEKTGELLYDNEFTEVEFFGVVGMDIGVPARAYADFVVNTEADSEDSGFMVGGTLGKAKEPGSWEVDYNYRDLEANAVVGAFTDSDSGGGGTDVEGHRVQGTYQLSKNWQTSATLFFDQIDGGSTDYVRSQVDLIAKF